MKWTLSENTLQRPLEMLLLDQVGPAWGSVVLDWWVCRNPQGPFSEDQPWGYSGSCLARAPSYT